MASLGYYLLLAAFVVCAYAASISVAGARRRSTALVESGIGAFYLVAAIMATASAIIEYAFISGDYSIVYVQHYSDSVQPLFYRITSYWGGLDGSIMFWVFMLSLFGSAAVYVNRERHRELIPYVVAVIAVVEMFFLFLMVIHNNPFQTFLTEQHADGQGLSPLLQNFYMAIHPPMLYLGFVGLTIPYAFGMAALITGHLDDSWLRAVRRWTMVAWLFLSIGLMLGMLWAYEELGWGGYWAWDPVENAAALPWFTATAFLHSVMVQERRGMLRVWNVTLVIITFFLTIVGTFLTRSGVVQSVHAFGDDPALARLFTIFMVTILVVSFGYVIYRLPLLRARNELDSWVSREAAFLVNNWILLVAALFVLFATIFPTLTQAVTGERITVGPPFYNKWMLPIGLTLLVLTGVGPLLAWRKSTLTNLRDQFLFPVITALLVGAGVAALGVRLWSAGICFAFCGLVVATITQEFWRGARVRQGATGTDMFTALVGLVARNRRRYGGYIVHVGIVLIFLGFAGNGFKREETALLKPGQQMKVGSFTVRYNGLKVTDDGQKQMITGSVVAMQNGKELARMYPARWYFRKHEQEPTSEVAIRRGIDEDIYVVMAAFTVQDQTASIEVIINPLINWVWLGFGVLAIGTGIAFLPESALAFATSSVPANAVTTGMLLLALVLWPVAARAQTPPSGHMVSGDDFAPLESRSPVEKAVGRKLICMCGDQGCGKQLAGECACSFASGMRMEIAQMAHEGKSEDQIVGFYLAKYGSSEVLAEPPNRGFDRLSWLFPYAVGIAGLITIGVVTHRWTHPSGAGAGSHAPIDPDLDARLDDELRNLD
jgi:cytochrome c-type biogenesis protein CcmF